MMETTNLTCDDVNARLIDLVYGEGTASERRELQGHVDGCARCRADLAALGRTRATLRAQMDDGPPPPAAVRARILAAASEAVARLPELAPAAAAAAPAAAAARAPAVPAPVPARPRPEQPSLWQRLRARWTFPTLGVVGATAIVLIASRVFLNPERTVERGKQVAMGQAAAPAPSPARSEAPAPVAALPPAGAPAASAELRPRPARAHAHGAPARAAAAAPPSDDQEKVAKGDVDDARAAEIQDRVRRMQDLASSARPVSRAAEPLMKPKAKLAAPPPPPPSRYRAGEAGRDDLLEGIMNDKSPRGGASAQAPAAAPAPPPSAPALVDRTLARNKREVYQEESPASAPAEAAEVQDAPAPPSRVASRRTSLDEAQEDEAGPAKKEKKAKDAPSTVEALSRRADQLYAAGHWDEAVAAYEELLRRFPSADGVPRWRVRVAAAHRAVVAERAAASKAAAPKAAAASKAAPAAAKAAPTAAPAADTQ
jgi:anti-sigma factor RsiW